MKKSLLSFSMLILCIGFLSSKTFAQDAPGDAGGEFSGLGVDGGISAMVQSIPAGVKNVKRNNGDASSAYGVAEARLSFTKGSNIGTPQLYRITYLVGGEVCDAVMLNCIVVDSQKGYISYSLKKNLNPAKKLMFHFKNSDGTGTGFSIPETN
jgi:hypothetical protein